MRDGGEGHHACACMHRAPRALAVHACMAPPSRQRALQVDERRTNMPLAQQRRGDLYELVDKTAGH